LAKAIEIKKLFEQKVWELDVLTRETPAAMAFAGRGFPFFRVGPGE